MFVNISSGAQNTWQPPCQQIPDDVLVITARRAQLPEKPFFLLIIILFFFTADDSWQGGKMPFHLRKYFECNCCIVAFAFVSKVIKEILEMKRFSCMGFKICRRLIVLFRKGWQWHLFWCYSSSGRMCASKTFVRRVTWGPFVWRLLCRERDICKSPICSTAAKTPQMPVVDSIQVIRSYVSSACQQCGWKRMILLATVGISLTAS